MKRLSIAVLFALACGASASFAADDYRVEAIDSAPEGGELAAAIGERLAGKGLKIVTDQGRTLCEIWPVKSWQVAAGFAPSGEVNYPLELGELVGVIRFARNGGDFRGQKIRKGAYTMRYALQPQDGNHVGTSDTRDFVVLVPAADDKDAKPLAKEKLFKQSTNASGTAHPAILSLLPPGKEANELPRMVQHEGRGLWAVDFAGKSQDGGKVLVELVVVGHSAE